MIFHLGTQWLTFMAILQGSESVNTEVVENCVYLGSQLFNEGGSEADMMWRIALAGVTFHG